MNALLRRGLAAAIAGLAVLAAGAEPDAASPPVLELTMKRIDGTPQDLLAYRGKVVLIVNVASRCGFTRQYAGLEKLYERYGERGLVVLGFPSNDFAGQEPGTNREIAEFCRSTYGVRFPMFEKIHVRGEHKHELYARLTGLPEPLGGEVAWNFQKYLLDRSGRVVAKFAPSQQPEDPELIRAIERLLRGPAG